VSRPAYTALGWVVWQVGTRVAKRRVAAARPKLIAAAIVGVTLAGGAAAAVAARPDGD
jgi:hypothetical protein